MSQNWQFVSSQPHGGAVDPRARRLIRENAMRSFRRGQRCRKVAQFQEKQAPVEPADDDGSPQPQSPESIAVTSSHSANSRERTPEEHQDEQGSFLGKQAVVLGREPGDALDPFHTIAMYNHHEAPGLFMHCRPTLW